MTMTDPIADMLARVRNASSAMHPEVAIPASKIKENIARILMDEGYIDGIEMDEAQGHPIIKLKLRYSDERERAIAGIRRISKPGRRVYRGAGELPRVLGGLGVAIISTSQGLMTDRQARKAKVGGEVLAYVW
ncbi:MAG: small subunit ribosomal protein [Actinomycetota bacterium]|jgi:small subunit ribosomal protein S8|nr:small subunit ribosomal protein [Actinomycetota bacterium]